MSNRIWPGALCILTKSAAGNNGAICEVLSASDVPGWDWFVRFQKPIRWTRTVRGNSSPVGTDGYAHDWQLTPITPPPGTETTDTDVPADAVSA